MLKSSNSASKSYEHLKTKSYSTKIVQHLWSDLTQKQKTIVEKNKIFLADKTLVDSNLVFKFSIKSNIRLIQMSLPMSIM